MKVALIGKSGQLGHALIAAAPPETELFALGRDVLDLSITGEPYRALSEIKPDLVINAAAYTAVDQAESEPELANQINAEAPGELAAYCQQAGARLIHISTDFVFGGAADGPRTTNEPCNPASVYGKTKLAGERNIAQSEADFLILRTAWLYSATGKNFLNTMLRLMQERDEISVVSDQVGTPTSCDALARAVWSCAEKGVSGIHHCTDAGAASWYDFACAIQHFARHSGLLECDCKILPVTTAEYPTPALRPRFSVLDCRPLWAELGVVPAWWQSNLQQIIDTKGARS